MQHESLATLVGDFLAARATRKPSVHTLQAYRRDLLSIIELLGPETTTLTDLSPRLLRAAFARFAADRSPASVARAWSTWNAFFTFLVTEQCRGRQSDVGGGQAAAASPLPQAACAVRTRRSSCCPR